MTSTARQLGRLVVLGAAALAVGLLGAGSAAASATLEDALAGHINVARQAAGLPPLVVDTQLVRVGRAWSDVMAGEDRLRHNPQLFDEVRGDWTRLGENVGVGERGEVSLERLVEEIHDGFMASPAHRDNVLDDFEALGVGMTLTEEKLWVTVAFVKGARPVQDATPQVEEARRVSRAVFPDASGGPGRPAGFAVVARAEVFADALAGSALAGSDAPILFTPGPWEHDPDPVLHPRTRAEVDRVLGGSGVVYLLGGPGAVSRAAEEELRRGGYAVRRLAGASRVETSIAVAREVLDRRGPRPEVLLARADDWADAVSGGAYAAFAGSPLVLTSNEELHPAVAAFLADQRPTDRVALGGPAALADRVVADAGARRVFGPDRAATSVAIARDLWGRRAAASGDRYVATPAFDERGWAYALAFAPWSAAHRSPQLLVGDQLPASVEEYLAGLGYGRGVAGSVDAASGVPASVVDRIRHLLGS